MPVLPCDVNFVEQPARLSCGVELAVTEWSSSYKRGTVMGSSAPYDRLSCGSDIVAV